MNDMTTLVLLGREHSIVYREARLEFERQFLETALRLHRGNITNTARAVHMGRRNLQFKLRKLSINVRAIREGRTSPDPRTQDAVRTVISVLRQAVGV